MPDLRVLAALLCVGWVFADQTIEVGFDGQQQIRQKPYDYATSDDKIFVSIAAFMDPELLPTIKDILAKAKYPEKLDFGILIQEDTKSEFPYEGLPNFNVRRVHYLESKGVGWARYTGRQLYGNQTYLLQLDSHHRFVPEWDVKLVQDFHKCIAKGSSKPILSTYLPSYSMGSRAHEQYTTPHKVISERYYDSGKVRFVSYTAPEARSLSAPHPSAVISAHFIFAWGYWLSEVPYDPFIYFDGEEDTLSARSWTHGYDIFYPHRNLIFHLYGRTDQKKHWDIHPDWWRIKRRSEARVRQVLGQEPSTSDFGEFGMGTVRTYEDFQNFSGLYFPYWHLGYRALTGDVTVQETNFPPKELPGAGRCMHSFADGEVVDIGNNKWEERRGDAVSTFERLPLSDATQHLSLLLLDEGRGMFLKIDNNKLYWAARSRSSIRGKDKTSVAAEITEWVEIASITATGCL